MTDIDISPEAVERLACILEGRGGFVKDSTITVTLRALSAALTQAQDHLDRWINTCAAQDQTLADMRVELTQSRAETAAVIELAAHALDAVAKQWSCGHESKHCDCARDIEQWTFAADEVRALATPDQSSALAAIEAAAEARGMRKAAECCQAVANEAKSYHIPQMTLGAMSCRDDILAAIPHGDTTND